MAAEWFAHEQIRQLAGMSALGEDDQAFLNPSDELQITYVGTSGEVAYSSAVLFLEHALAKTGIADLAAPSVLDFGCGWGRMLRLIRFAPRLQHLKCFGCDPNARMVDINRRTVPGATVFLSEALPPSIFRSALFDLIYAYSVFSHLNAFPHLAWAQEFGRILRPGGYATVTTRPRSFIETCRKFATGALEIQTAHQQTLASLFRSDESLERYDAGELVFGETPSYDKAVYGEAVVPRSFIERSWGQLGFDLVDWSEPSDFNQCFAVLKKR